MNGKHLSVTFLVVISTSAALAITKRWTADKVNEVRFRDRNRNNFHPRNNFHSRPPRPRTPKWNYKNAHEFRERNVFGARLSNPQERQPSDFVGNNPLKFHVEANYDDPIWPNMFGINFPSNQVNVGKQQNPQKPKRRNSELSFSDLLEHDRMQFEDYDLLDNPPYLSAVPWNEEVSRNQRPMRRSQGFRDQNANDFNRHSFANENEISRNNRPKECDQFKCNQKLKSENGIHEEQTRHKKQHDDNKESRQFRPNNNNNDDDDELEIDVPPRIMMEFFRRHGLLRMPSWNDQSDPRLGLKNVKVVRPRAKF